MRIGQPGEALAEVLRVLAREQRRRHDDRGLLAVDRRGEGGAQRHLRLAEADVAADEPVHRPAGGEIVERRFDGVRLVLRLVIGKAGAEFVVEPLRRNQPRRGPGHALRRDADQLARHFAHPLLQPRFARLPARSAELVEFARFRAVARQELQVLDRQEEPVAAGIVDFEAVVRRARRLDRLQADEAPDAVVDVDDEIAGGQGARLGQHVVGAAAPLRLADQPVAENVLLADNGEVRRLEALFERDHRERQRAGSSGLRLVVGRDELERFEPVLRQHMAQPLARAVAPAGDDRIEPPLAQSLDVRDRRVEHIGVLVLPLGGKIAPDPAAAVDDIRRAGLRLEGRQPRQRRAVEPLIPFVLSEIEPAVRQRLIVGLGRVLRIGRAARGIGVGDLRDALACRLLGAADRARRARRRHSRTACPASRRAAAASARGRSRGAPR